MSRYTSATLIGIACVAGFIGEANAQAPATTLTLHDAIQRALGDDPGVRAADASRAAAEAGLRQAGRFADPTLDILQENIEGTGSYAGRNRAETTYSVRQPLELGGDRGARRRFALGDLGAANSAANIRKLDLIEEVEFAYIDAQAAEATRAIAEDRLTVARELSAAVERRVRAARDPLMAGARATARLAEAELDMESARLTAAAAREKLASYWGGAADFTTEAARFDTAPEATTAQAPDVALADALAARARAQVDIERARAFPDVEFVGGYRRFNEARESAYMLGVSVPLPIWNGNRNAVTRARAESDRASYERDAKARAIAREVTLLRAQASAARQEVAAFDTRVIPASEEALARAREGYAQGGFSYLDVLDAQRALADARLRRVSALRNAHRAQASLARLTGARAEEISQ